MKRIHYTSFIKFNMVLIIILLCLNACTEPISPSDHSSEQQEHDLIESSLPIIEPPIEPAPYYTEARLIAVGDIMMHLPQTRSGYNPATRTYNFDSFFTEVSPLLSKGDWVIGNLETPLAGADLGYTGFPQFNAPPELADSLKQAGFNILTTTNNHSLDRREKGIIRTLENLRSRGIVPVGTAASPEEAEIITMVRHHDITMAVLAYTYGTNGIPVPEGKPYLVSLIDEERMKEDIDRARNLGADLITIALHFGNEYQPEPTKEQQALVAALFREGADIILGSHPHVLQPYEIVDVTTVEGIHKKGIVIYSMGNFISNQDRFLNRNKPTDVGVIFEVGIRKHFPSLTVELIDIKTTPTYVHKHQVEGKLQYRILPLESVLTDRNDTLLLPQDYERLETYYHEASTHLESIVAEANVNLP
jgi:poly-gamma-glutamate capsule biosynthesis protein CapA/YwtB (metallophosphatase superfamily)